jgi:hypothetical protein
MQTGYALDVGGYRGPTLALPSLLVKARRAASRACGAGPGAQAAADSSVAGPR